MKRFIFYFIAAIVIASAGTAAHADTGKIGVIFFNKIMNESSAGKLNQSKLKNKNQEWKKKLESEKQSLEKMGKTLKAQVEAKLLSEEKKREKEKEFAEKIKAYNQNRQMHAKELQAMEIKLVREMRQAVLDIAKDIGKKEGFLLILDLEEAGVYYMPDNIDLTDRVIKRYNAQTAKSK